MENKNNPQDAEDLRARIQLGVIRAIVLGAFWIHPGLGIIALAILVGLVLFH